VKDFRIAKFKTEFINITDGKDIVFDFAKIFSLPLNQYALNERQVKKIFGLSL
jgi:hypothetical protein